jgi:hypothetical protein
LSSLAPDLGDYLRDQHRAFCSATLHRNIHQPTHIIKLTGEDFSRNSPISRTKLSSNPATNLAWTPRKVDQDSNTIKSPTSLPGTRSNPDIRAKMRQWIVLLHTKSLPIVSLEHFHFEPFNSGIPSLITSLSNPFSFVCPSPEPFSVPSRDKSFMFLQCR